MPRDGSPRKSAAGAAPLEPMSIGEVASPPFAVLPDPGALFLKRSERLAQLAPGHPLEGYLRFLSQLTRIQHDVTQHAVATGLPAIEPPAPELLAQARAHGMPPLSIWRLEPDDAAQAVLAALLERIGALEMPDATRAVVTSLSERSADARNRLLRAVAGGTGSAEPLAEQAIAAAALQVHLTRCAALLDASRLVPVSDGACPACGSGPAASMVVGWTGAQNTRFCACSSCGTHWNVPRIKCLKCGSEKGVSYQGIEGGGDLVKGETCEDCGSYVKILYQSRNASIEPIADDVASLDLDMVLREAGWQRAGANPFLLGY